MNEENKTVPESHQSPLGCPYYLQSKNKRNVLLKFVTTDWNNYNASVSAHLALVTLNNWHFTRMQSIQNPSFSLSRGDLRYPETMEKASLTSWGNFVLKFICHFDLDAAMQRQLQCSDKQTDKQTDIRTKGKTDRQIDRQTDIRMEGKTDRRTLARRERKTDRQTGRRTYGRRERQTDR